MSNLYEADFYTWANEQAALLREGKIATADVANIAEELESMGRAERNALQSQIERVLKHLLKWQHQPGRRGRSWQLTIANARDRVGHLLAQNPGLKASVRQVLAEAYPLARREAAIETGLDLDAFPSSCPWTFERICNADFWPVISE